MGNNIAYKVVGIDTIRIKMHDDVVKTLTNLRHVPKLNKIFVSLGSIDSMHI